jgi:hypothetical protein
MFDGDRAKMESERLRRDRAARWRERGLSVRGPGAEADAWPLVLPIAALIAGWMVMCWPWLAGTVTIPWDAKAHFQPQIQFLAESLHRGESPFWNPYVFAGHPQIADPQSLIFSLPILILALLNASPSSWAVDVTVLGMQLAGGVALLLWMRDRGWHWGGGIVAGLVFCFGASMAWRVQHTGQVLSLAYLPFALLFLDRALTFSDEGRRGMAITCAIGLGIVAAVILLGRDQVALLSLYLIASMVVWRWVGDRAPVTLIRASIGPLLIGAVVAAVLVAVPLVLTAMLAAESNRPAIDFDGAGRGSLHPALLLTFVIPQLFGAAGRMEDYWGPPSFAWPDTGLFIAQNMGQVYIGLLPFLLILVALVRGQLWAREIRFFTVAFGCVVLYALGWYTPVFRAIYEIVPGVKLYRRPADATFLIGALGAVLAGYATHRLFKEPWKTFGWREVGASALVLSVAGSLAIGLGSRIDRLALVPSPLVTAVLSACAATAALWFARSRAALEPWVAALALAGVTAGDLAYNNGPSTSSAMPPSMYEAMEPDTRNPLIVKLKALTAAGRSETRRDRIELLGLGFHWPNLSMTHGLENTLGYNPLRLGVYSRASGAEDHVGLPEQRKFPPSFPSFDSVLARKLGLRYVASPSPLEVVDKGLQPGAMPAVFGSADGLILENARALPRVMFAREVINADFADIVRTGVWPEHDPGTTVLFEVAAGFRSDRKGPGRVRIVRYRNTDVEIEADSAGGGWVVLRDLWHPWWVAEVDGREVPVQRADVLFRAVPVPAGRTTVRFRFRPVAGALRQLAGRVLPF